MGGLQTGRALVVKGQQRRGLDIMAGIGTVRVGGTGSGVIDQTEIRADVVFHKVFFVK